MDDTVDKEDFDTSETNEPTEILENQISNNISDSRTSSSVVKKRKITRKRHVYSKPKKRNKKQNSMNLSENFNFDMHQKKKFKSNTISSDCSSDTVILNNSDEEIFASNMNIPNQTVNKNKKIQDRVEDPPIKKEENLLECNTDECCISLQATNESMNNSGQNATYSCEKVLVPEATTTNNLSEHFQNRIVDPQSTTSLLPSFDVSKIKKEVEVLDSADTYDTTMNLKDSISIKKEPSDFEENNNYALNGIVLNENDNEVNIKSYKN
ncbi:AAA_11 domain-containing protein, partial [Caerostris darwini]